jgi:hypothetical protein
LEASSRDQSQSYSDGWIDGGGNVRSVQAGVLQTLTKSNWIYHGRVLSVGVSFQVIEAK